MTHKGCGGAVRESRVLFYRDPELRVWPAVYCEKCNKELMNEEIEIDVEKVLPSLY